MASEAQAAANRRNALKSTGPKTEEGKAIAAGNSLKHGLTARDMVVFDEKPKDFVACHDSLRADFAPADTIEEQLVERIALCAWRLRRICRIEARLIDSYRAKDTRVYGTELASVIDRASDGLDTLSRHEATLDRALQRAQILLERRQARRRSEFVPPPLAVTVTGLEALDEARPSDAKPEFYKTKPIFPGGTEAADAALCAPEAALTLRRADP